MTRLFVVTGLQAEARLVRAALLRHDHRDSNVTCAAMRAERAYALAAAATRDGAELLVSFGLCGGLDPALQSGGLLIPGIVVTADGACYATDPALSVRLRSALAAVSAQTSEGCLLGGDKPVRSAHEKRSLFAALEAHAVDMESHGVLRAAHEARVPALVVRAVADPAERTLPSAALAGAGADGDLHPLAVAGALTRRPWEVPALLRVAADARRGRIALAAAAGCLADLFGRD